MPTKPNDPPTVRDCERRLKALATKVGAEKFQIQWGSVELSTDSVISLAGKKFGLWTKRVGASKREVFFALHWINTGIDLAVSNILGGECDVKISTDSAS